MSDNQYLCYSWQYTKPDFTYKKKNLNNNYVVYARGVADTTSIYDNNYLQSKNTALKKKKLFIDRILKWIKNT